MSRRGNGEGSIYQLADGRWRAAVSAGFVDGKPRRKVFTAATRNEVKNQLTRALRDQQLGIPLADERITVGAFIKGWLKNVAEPRVRPKTFRTYTDLFRLHVIPTLGSKPLAKLSPFDVRELLSAKTAAGLSAGTVKHILVAVRNALATALKDGTVPRNVATLVDPPRAARKETIVFTPEQARSFLDALRGDRFEALFTVAVALGLRQGEILGLGWKDIDLESSTLTVRNALQRIGGKMIIVEPKSASSRRTVHMPGVTISALIAHRLKQDAEREWAGSDWRHTDFVFTSSLGTPLDPRNVVRRFRTLLKETGLPMLRFHDLRHSAASLLLAQGVSPKYIADLLGHSQVSFTMQTYAHVLPHVKRDVASKMDEILGVATSVANLRLEAKPN